MPPTPAHLLICSLSFFTLWPKHRASGNCTAWGHCPLIPGQVMDSMDKSESGRERRGPTSPAAPSQFWWLLCLRLLLEAPLPSSCGPWEKHPPPRPSAPGFRGVFYCSWAVGASPSTCLQGEPSGSSPAGESSDFFICSLGADTPAHPAWSQGTFQSPRPAVTDPGEMLSHLLPPGQWPSC